MIRFPIDLWHAPISGAISQSFTPESSGDNAVEISQNGCIERSLCFQITVISLNENNSPYTFTEYPSPTDGKFIIDLGQIYNDVTIKITDLRGREIKHEEYSGKQLVEMELNVATGIYLVHVLLDGKQLTVIRLIKN